MKGSLKVQGVVFCQFTEFAKFQNGAWDVMNLQWDSVTRVLD